MFGVCVEDGDVCTMDFTPLDTKAVAEVWAVMTEVRFVLWLCCLVRIGGCELVVEMKCHFI